MPVSLFQDSCVLDGLLQDWLPSPPSPGFRPVSIILSASINLPVVDTSCNRIRLLAPPGSVRSSRFVQVAACTNFHTSVQRAKRTGFHLVWTAPLDSSSEDRLACFYLLATVSNAGINTDAQVFEYLLLILSGIYIDTELLDIVILFHFVSFVFCEGCNILHSY